MSANRVAVADARYAGLIGDRLDKLIPPLDKVYLVPSPVEVCHDEGYHIATAVYEDDNWWLDFSHYGEDLSDDSEGRAPSLNARSAE